MGRDISENGFCYIVRDWRDFGSCCKKGNFPVYSETSQKNIARGWRWWALFELGALAVWGSFAV
jgi:hypothetical protein